MEKMTVNSKLEQAKIVGIDKSSFWESVPQSSYSWEDVRKKRTCNYWNTQGITLICLFFQNRDLTLKTFCFLDPISTLVSNPK